MSKHDDLLDSRTSVALHADKSVPLSETRRSLAGMWTC